MSVFGRRCGFTSDIVTCPKSAISGGRICSNNVRVEGLLYLLNHFVRLAKQQRRNGDAEGLSGFEIDEEFELCRLLYREFTRLGTLQYFINVNSRPAADRETVYSIRQKGSRYQSLPHENGCRQTSLERQLADQFSLRIG
jgi:hypothetical protein